jgi:hypothetical protein
LPYQIDDVNASNIKTVYMPVTDNGTQYYTPFNGLSQINNMTFSTLDDKQMIDYVIYPNSALNIRVKGSNVEIIEYTSGNSRVIYDGYVEDIEDGLISAVPSGNLTDVIIDIGDATYTFEYGQDLRAIGGLINSDRYIKFMIVNAFIVDTIELNVSTGQSSQISIYGCTPYSNSGKYAIRLHKYIDHMERDLALTFPAGLNHSIQLRPSEHYTYDVTFPDVAFDTTAPFVPYTLTKILEQIDNTDLELESWTLDNSFTQSSRFNLGFVALSGLGEELLYDLFSFNDSNRVAHVTFITMPDTFNVVSADGSPVMRITYNGSIITPMVSTTQVNLYNSSFTHQSNGINQEVLDFNIPTAPIDISGN